MTSPDFRQYVDLTINDKQPGDLYAEAVDYALISLPEFAPRIGTVEDALLQASSYIGGELIAAVNRLPNGLMEGLLRLFGLIRKEATYATGTAIFTAVDTAGVSIPTGTQVAYLEATSAGTVLHVFETTAAGTITSGNSTSGEIPIRAIATGSVPALVDGDDLTILTQTNRLLSAEIQTAITQGLAAESNAEYFARGATYLASLSQGLVTSTQITNRVLSLLSGTTTPEEDFTDVSLSTGWRCKVYDLTELVTIEPTGSFNRSSGTVTVTVPSGHGIGVNDEIHVFTPGGTAFDGYFTVTASNATDISWAQSGSNASASATSSFIYHLDSLATAAADAGGQITLVVCDEHGDALSLADSNVVVADIQDRTVAGLTVSLMPAMIVDLTCTIDIVIKAGYSSLEVLAAVEEYINTLVSPKNWDWQDTVRANYIIARVAQVEGVDYVDSVVLDSPTSAIASKVGDDIVFAYRGTLPSLTATIGEA